jgi:hypothetical protein
MRSVTKAILVTIALATAATFSSCNSATYYTILNNCLGLQGVAITLSQNSAPAGSGNIMIKVTQPGLAGTSQTPCTFIPTASVLWNGSANGVATTYIDSKTLQATIPANLLANPTPANAPAHVTVQQLCQGASGAPTVTAPASFAITPVAPTLTSISPTSGVQGSNVNVALTGANFVSGATVNFSGTGVTVASVVVVSSTSITATLQISATAGLGRQNVSVTTSTGTSASVTFTVNPPSPAPTVASISPASGVQGTNVNVTLTGANFVSGATVNFGGAGVTVGNVVVVSSTSITATFQISATAALGAQNVSVTTSGGTSGNVTFTVNSAPVAPSITLQPADQTVTAGTNVTFTSTASGSPNPTVQWQVSTDKGVTFSDVVGATSTTLTFVASSSQNGNQYRAVFTNIAGTATSQAATLTVTISYLQGNILTPGNQPALDDNGQIAVVGNSSTATVFVDTAGSWSSSVTLHNPDGLVASVGISGNGQAIAVGGHGHAFVYVEPAAGWASATGNPDATLAASDGQTIGTTVAVNGNGDTVAVGTPHGTTTACSGSACAVYVFLMPVGGWVSSNPPTPVNSTAKLTTTAGSNLSISLSIDAAGNTIVAGQASDNASLGIPDFTQIYVRPPGGWQTTSTPTATLTANDLQIGDSFGFSVGISGDGTTVVVGAPFHPLTCNPTCTSVNGAAYVFLKPSSGTWATTNNQNAELAASDGTKNDQFGFAASISDAGGTIFIGVPSHPINLVPNNPGAVYVFQKPAAGWASLTQIMNETQELAPSPGQAINGQSVTPAGSFGRVVSISRDASTLAVGGTAQVGGVAAGVVYLF